MYINLFILDYSEERSLEQILEMYGIVWKGGALRKNGFDGRILKRN